MFIVGLSVRNHERIARHTNNTKNLFIVLAKDNIDFNATSSAAAQHFHGTSMTAIQFISEENLGNEILCNTGIEFTSNITAITSKKSTSNTRIAYKCLTIKRSENTIVRSVSKQINTLEW